MESGTTTEAAMVPSEDEGVPPSATGVTKNREEKAWEQLTPNDYLDNSPPDSLEGLAFDKYGTVEGHPNWGAWTPSLNLWVSVCIQDMCFWYWQAEVRLWVKDDTIFEKQHGK